MPFFGGSSQPRNRTRSPVGRFLTLRLSGGRFLHFLQPQFPCFQGSMNSTLGQGNMCRVLVPPGPDHLYLESLMTGLGILAAEVFPFFLVVVQWASQVVLVVKTLPASAGDIRGVGSIRGSGRFPWRRAWQPTPVFLPGESHGQRSLVGYSPWGRRVRGD